MKKLISIGVAVALLAIVVLPLGVAAQGPCDIGNYTAPTTYAKIPFAIVQSGFDLVGQILGAAGSALSLPAWITPALVSSIGAWAGGPLSWSVDMLGWGLGLVSTIVSAIAPTLGLPSWIAPILGNVTCAIFQPFSCNITGAAFQPCG